MVRSGHNAEAIVSHLKEVFQRTTLFVAVQTLENLVKGGRIGRAKGWISSILNIKPIAMLEQGSLSPFAKVRTTKQIIDKLLERFKEDTHGKELSGIGISHANNLPLAERLKEELGRLTSVPVRIRPATPVISTHTGEGAIGFMYYTS